MSESSGRSVGFIGRFTVLRGAVRELWIVLGAKLLAILAYAVMNSTLVLWLSSGYSTFSTVDFRDFPAFLARLREPAPADRISRFLVEQLSPANRDRLRDPASGADPRFRVALVEDINRIVKAGPLYDADRFAGVALSGPTQALLAKNPARAELVHLNRLLLQDAYRAEIVSPSRAGPGYSDERAGYFVAMWSTVMTLVTVLVGSLVDAIGLRKALLLGFAACILARAVMTFALAKWLVLPFGLFGLAVGEALMTPVMVAAVHRYSTTAQRSMAFSLYYAMMNGGFALAGWVFDFVRQELGEYGSFTLPVLGLELGTYRTLFLASLLFTLPNLALTWFFLRGGVEATDTGVIIVPEQPRYAQEPLGRALVWTVRDALRDTVRIFAGLWRQPAFYKFLAFLSLVVAVRLIFFHMHYTYPKFGLRELGAGAPIGKLWALNSILIIVLVPVVGAWTQRISAYRMVTVGSSIAAASVFFMVLPPAWFQSWADGWPGHAIGHVWLGLSGPVHPYYVTIFLYIVFLSIGEAFYSPRLYEYPAAIAPKGQEASYMALSYLPFFVAKFFVGMFSGEMLARFCPETGPRQSHLLWLIIALMALVTPVGLLLLRRFIRVREAGRED